MDLPASPFPVPGQMGAPVSAVLTLFYGRRFGLNLAGAAQAHAVLSSPSFAPIGPAALAVVDDMMAATNDPFDTMTLGDVARAVVAKIDSPIGPSGG